MARVTGRALSLKQAASEWSGEITNYVLESSDLDSPTFAQVMAGAADYKLTLTVQQDMAANSLWRYLWDNAGTSGVAVNLAPYGNATATVGQPHIPLTCTLPRKPSIGGEASYDGKPLTVNVQITVDTVAALKTT